MKALKFISASILVFCLFAAMLCAQEDMPDIRVKPSSVEITGIDAKKIKLKLFAEIAYPQTQRKPLLLASIKSKVYVNKSFVMNANTAKNLEFSKTITSDFNIALVYDDLLKAAPALKDKEQVCEIKSTFYFIVDKDLGFNTREVVFTKKLPSYKSVLKSAAKKLF